MNLSSLDLNLLVVVDAVLRERSATRAAAKLNVTQSAVSNALARARDTFGDALVVRVGRGFALTPRGEALAPKLATILRDIRQAFDDSSSLPESTTRRFTVACTDALSLVVIPKLLERFAKRLPHASLRVVTLDHVMASQSLADADVDVLIGSPPRTPTGCEAEVLFEDRMVVLACKRNQEVGRRLTLARYAHLPHAELALFGEPDDRIDRALATRGLSRRVDVSVPHIAALPFLVRGTRRITTTIESVAQTFAGALGLRVLTPPLRLAPVVIRQIWHRRVAEDGNVTLLRELVRDTCVM